MHSSELRGNRLVGSLFLKAVDLSFGQWELKFYRLKLERFLKQKEEQTGVLCIV